jgi:hypothetical protein
MFLNFAILSWKHYWLTATIVIFYADGYVDVTLYHVYPDVFTSQISNFWKKW